MKELVQMIQSLSRETGNSVKTTFSSLLWYIAANFNPDPKPNPLWFYSMEQNKQFHAMMLKWLDIMATELQKREWYDAWGDLFMELTPKGGSNGQFFTPADLCDMMADCVSSRDDIVAREPSTYCNGFGKRVTVSDPTCGSGRNLLAAHAKFIKAGARKPYLIGEDIDIDCCRMTAINLMAHGCFGEVICHNTLTDPKGLRVGFIVNEGLYPLEPGFPTVRVVHEPERFVALR